MKPLTSFNNLAPQDLLRLYRRMFGIILGGGVIGMKKFPRGDFERFLRRHLRQPVPAKDLKIHYSTNCDQAGVLGGAHQALAALRRN